MEFTIVSAQHKKDLPPKEGMAAKQVVVLRLTDGTTEHEAEWLTVTTTDVDALPGTRIAGKLEPSQYGMKFRKDSQSFGGGGQRGRSPEDTASIVRQHSQHMAVLLLQAKATAGVLTEEDLKPPKIRSLTDWFDDDVAAGVERKHPSQRMVGGLPVRNEPERTGAPDVPVEPYPAAAPADGTEPFAA